MMYFFLCIYVILKELYYCIVNLLIITSNKFKVKDIYFAWYRWSTGSDKLMISNFLSLLPTYIKKSENVHQIFIKIGPIARELFRSKTHTAEWLTESKNC
jgi:hypothetical protein